MEVLLIGLDVWGYRLAVLAGVDSLLLLSLELSAALCWAFRVPVLARARDILLRCQSFTHSFTSALEITRSDQYLANFRSGQYTTVPCC